MNKKKKIVAWILLLFWMSLIFYMSNQPADISNGQSDLVIRIFSYMGIKLNDHFGNLASFIVRKGAHFTEYLILYLLSYNLNRYYFNKSAKLYSILFVFLYACSDEVHQFFIQGREMHIRDIIIDTSGGSFGYLVLFIKDKIKG
ncbi:VanZ family protein [Clostridium sp.]|uniref:VanZ family protein n=1 Tax=Clostridium sp. TaxID=1506 RepID=UPI00263293FB|nr:VanZ family protein [Clostridium sp.]